MEQNTSKNENSQDPSLWDTVSQEYALSPEESEIELAKEIEELLKSLDINSDAKLLEAGCGTGHLSGYLATKGYDTTLLDFSKVALHKAEEYYKRNGLKGNFILADIFEITEKKIGTYDVVWNSGVLEHFDGWQILQMIKEMGRASTKWVIILVPNSKSSPYLSFRRTAMEKGQWKWGLEILRDSMKEITELAGLEFVGERYIGKSFCKDFVKYVNSFNKTFDPDDYIPKSDDQSYLRVLIAKPIKGKISLVEDVETLKKVFKIELESLRKTYYFDTSIMTEKLIQLEHLQSEFLLQQRIMKAFYNSKIWKIYAIYKKSLKGTIIGTVLEKIINSMINKGQENSTNKKIQHNVTSTVHLQENLNQLQLILNEHKSSKGIIIYSRISDWNGPLFQRPQHIARNLSLNGWLCFYCSPNQYDDIDGFQKLNENLYLTNQYEELIDKLDHFIIIISSGNLGYTIDQLENLKKKAVIVYDYLDEISVARKVSRKISDTHKYLMKNSDIVIATAKKLYAEALQIRKKDDVLLLSNGVDYNHFHINRDPSHIPDVMRKIIQKSNPIIGYFGAFASWFDYELIRYVATKRSDLEFVLIGWDYDGSLNKNNITMMPNVHYLGVKNYPILPDYAIWFDVCVIPFIINDITQATSPIKLFEYMALGIPIVSTGLDESKKYESVLIATDYDDFVKKIEFALNLKNDEKYIDLLDHEAKVNTWEIRSKELDNILNHINPK